MSTAGGKIFSILMHLWGNCHFKEHPLCNCGVWCVSQFDDCWLDDYAIFTSFTRTTFFSQVSTDISVFCFFFSMSECAFSVEGQAQIALRQRLFSKRSLSFPMSTVDHSQEKKKIYFLPARQSGASYRLSGLRRKSHFKRRLLQTKTKKKRKRKRGRREQFQKSFKGFCQFDSTFPILFDLLREANKGLAPDVVPLPGIHTSYTGIKSLGDHKAAQACPGQTH